MVEASLSGEGFELVRNLMRINGFLGDLVELPLLMNEFSYNFALFGRAVRNGTVGVAAVRPPRGAELPWWQARQLVISPVFMGAEPDMIDAGPHRGVKVFKERIALARQLMDALPADAP